MRTIYSIGSEAIETVYTYEEWLKEYNRRETKNKTEDRTFILYETTFIRRNNGSYWNYNAVCIGWGCNIFACCAAFGNIFDVDKRKGYDILG